MGPGVEASAQLIALSTSENPQLALTPCPRPVSIQATPSAALAETAFAESVMFDASADGEGREQRREQVEREEQSGNCTNVNDTRGTSVLPRRVQFGTHSTSRSDSGVSIEERGTLRFAR